MERLSFDSNGKLIGVDGGFNNFSEDDFEEEGDGKLRKSGDLEFLKEDFEFEKIFEREFWNLNKNKNSLEPLKFSNGKSQEDVVKEIVEIIRGGRKVIFLHGTCGTGKSAIALNIARVLGKTSVVVPFKALQKQYEDDYTKNMHLIKRDGKKMKIAVITGRDNHDSIYFPGKSCANPELPENIKLVDKNYGKLLEYYKENPYVRNSDDVDIETLRRISVAPANPYWSPILPADFELKHFSDARKKRYMGADGKEHVFYYRKSGCSYYDQFLAYIMADVIIFNSAKYLSELSLGRKPMTEVEIIDEADSFLDGLFQQEGFNLTRFGASLINIIPEHDVANEKKEKILDLFELEMKNKKALGIDENKIFKIGETKLKEIFELILNPYLEAEIVLDEMNYANRVLESARNFKGIMDEVYVSFRKEEDNIYVKLVSTNLSGKLRELMNSSKALVFMSGTLHSENVLKKIFKIEDYSVVEAETLNFGSLEIVRTGKEFDCRYSNFSSGKKTREDYLNALDACMSKAKIPALIHVNAFQDLPSEEEKLRMRIYNVMSSERLKQIQSDDKTGLNVSLFKQGMADTLFTTKCSRGADFPGEMCNSIVFTKYPNPNVKDIFWKVLEQNHRDYFWEFYKDKAYREFLQRIYRALRSKDDHVFILSPDLRVLDSVGELQRKS